VTTTQEDNQRFKQADTLYRGGQYGEALKLLEDLSCRHPDTKNILYPRALCLDKLGREQEAWTLAKRLVEDFRDPRAQKLQQEIEARHGPPTPDLADAGVFSPDLNIEIPGVMAFGKTSRAASLRPPTPISAETPVWKYLAISGGVLVVLLVLVLPLVMSGGSETTTERVGTERVRFEDMTEEHMPAFVGLMAVSLVIGLLKAPLPLYLTLMFTGTNRHGQFLKDYLDAFVAVLILWLVFIPLAIIVCIGWIAMPFVAYKILNKRYEFGIGGFALLIGMGLVVSLALSPLDYLVAYMFGFQPF
jgi:hypothetical protein